jgi:hypothetical protein
MNRQRGWRSCKRRRRSLFATPKQQYLGTQTRAKAPPGAEGGFTGLSPRAEPQEDSFKAHHTFVSWV